jgi:phytoene synthase
MTSLPATISAPSRDTRVEVSRAYCERITRSAARNFYYGLKLLPEPKRSRMYALYAYMRALDDIADEDDGRTPQRRADDLETWRVCTHEAIAGRLPDVGPLGLWPAFAEMVDRCRMPARLFDDAIAGQQQDLIGPSIASFDALREYCYRVAGVVGIASIYVWGFEGGQETIELAIRRGLAFQLTNILRDLREDAAGGRVYLPTDELASAGILLEDLRDGRGGERFDEMVKAQIHRAESYYRSSAELESRIDHDSRPTLVAMTSIYHRLLRKIAKEPERVLRERVSLSLLDKLRIAARAMRAGRASR